ncbi:MAG: NAD(P)-dependent alcohol dehydrogenase [Thermomicrobiales bacterium]|nr:NAD(P)-dependent alcohol dehydrogenase [Thermomicrobiales bacterium]MCO5225803.1 NAD(P)-dependent alcohol dehydrogenase [Thermomicrobiales bacterium]MCO5226752.1 NAD(P)-dependent alcohol dehydrogenase [Thermomicrobiales bacterium]
MKTAVMTGIGQMQFEDRPQPIPGPKYVLIKVENVGICGSDLHYFESGRIGDFVVEPPFVLGHEVAGTVIGLGDQVTSLAVGDRVALEPNITCGECEFCRSGQYNLCPDVEFFATPPIDGTFQEYVTHPAHLCFKLPDSVSSMEGALIEPLAVGFHAATLGEAKIGQSALVFGCGCIGLVSMMALRAMGVSQVFMVDVMDARLHKAAELGATAAINGAELDVVEEVLRQTNGRGVDLVIETSGTDIAASQAINATRKGSTIVLVGYSKTGMVTFPMAVAINKELRFQTVFRYRHNYPIAIQAVADGRVNLKGIVTHEYEFDDIQRAMDESIADKATVVKAVMCMPGTPA